MFVHSSRVISGEQNGYDKYDLESYVLYSNPKCFESYYYIINSETGDNIFEFQDPLASKELIFRFFKPDVEEEQILIFASATETVSQGVYIFLLEHDKVELPGFIPYGVDDYNFSSLGFHSIVNKVNDKIQISFSDTNIIDHNREKLIDGNTIIFEITPTSISKITK